MPYKDRNKQRAAQRPLAVKYRAQLRARLFAVFGSKCVNCGCDDARILELNHIRGGGRKDRAKTQNCSAAIYRKALKDPNRKKKYNILCRICNALHYVQKIRGISGHHVSWSAGGVSV